MKLFGTDGVRGKANQYPMTPDIIMKLALASGQLFHNGDHRHIVVIGKDTRLSGYMVEPALTAGFVANGMNVILVGPLPTPAISMLVRSLRADLGVMISASHNPYYDNGIKFFGRDGYKLSSELEHKIEMHVHEGKLENLATPDQLGRASRLENADGRYIEFVKNTVDKTIRFDELKIVVDCAQGAAYKIAPRVFWELGAEVISINDEPSGFNINEHCGATSPQQLCDAVVKHKAHIGIALDGDADRLVVSDETGQLIDGDQILALIATSWHQKKLLSSSEIVGTVMSNMGLELYLNSIDLKLIRTPVGDRHVCDYMRENNCNLGGEQSGHIILSDYARTGDGLVAAVQLLSVLVTRKCLASELLRVFKPTPQLLKNIRLASVTKTLASSVVQQAIRDVESQLKENGRLLIRPSGTEPLLRLMAEGPNLSTLHHCLDHIIEVMHKVDKGN